MLRREVLYVFLVLLLGCTSILVWGRRTCTVCAADCDSFMVRFSPGEAVRLPLVRILYGSWSRFVYF